MSKKQKQPKQPRINKSKTQIIAEEHMKKEALRKRARVRDDLYPFLKEKDLSAKEINEMCYLMGQFVRQGFIQLQKSMKLEEIKMEDVLKGDDMKDYLHLYDMFRHETVMSALEIVEGMAKQIGDTHQATLKEKKFNEMNLQLY